MLTSSIIVTAFRRSVMPTTMSLSLARNVMSSSISHSSRTTSRRLLSSFAARSSQPPVNRAQTLLGAGALMVGSYVVLDRVLNTPTDFAFNFGRTLPLNARDYLHGTYQYVLGGLGITAASAVAAFRQGLTHRITRMSPFMFLGVSLGSTLCLSLATFATSHRESPFLKHALWASTMAAFGAVSLSSVMFLPVALLGRAALYTGGVVGSLSLVAMNADHGAFLWLGAPLMAGVTVIALSSVASMFVPVASTAFSVVNSISLYGGLVVFGGFVLYDTQKVLERGAQNIDSNPDFINESFALYMDTINIFIRIVQILSMQQSNSKRR